MLVEWATCTSVSRRWALAGALLLASVLLGGVDISIPSAAALGDAIDADDFLPALAAFAGIAGIGLLFGAATAAHRRRLGLRLYRRPGLRAAGAELGPMSGLSSG